MKSMIDTHSHIIPGLDDGSISTEQSIRMAKLASEAGISRIVATSHKMKGTYDFSVNELNKKVKALNNELKKRKIPITIIPGAENYAEYDIDLKFTINNKKYILIEFPMNSYPAFADEIIKKITDKKLIPIIAHPEKNSKFMQNPELIEKLVDKGCLIQLNTDSLSGRSKTVRDFAIFLLKNNIYHLLGSNAHSEQGYETFAKAMKILSKYLNEEQIKQITQTIPKKVIQGKEYVTEKIDFKEKFHTKFGIRAFIRRLF